MPSNWHSGTQRPLRSVALAASLLALVMLLAFPMLRARHFTARFRAPQTLSQFQRHIFVGQPENGPAELTAICPFPYTLLVNNVAESGPIKPMAGFRVVDRVPLPRLLLRLKLGSSRKSAPDPFL